MSTDGAQEKKRGPEPIYGEKMTAIRVHLPDEMIKHVEAVGEELPQRGKFAPGLREIIREHMEQGGAQNPKNGEE